MRFFSIILIAALLTGCAAAPKAQSPAEPLPEYTEASASALAFDPPIDQGEAHPEFARGPRAPSAFFGYEENSTELYISSFDDLQSAFGDYYSREAVSVRSGVRYR